MATADTATETLVPKTLADLGVLLESLGLSDIPPSRIVINPVPGTATEHDLTRLASGNSPRICELIDGVLVEKTVGLRESIIACILIRLIGNYVNEHRLGWVSGEQGGMKLGADRVRIPDVAFISKERWAAATTAAYPELAPDLAVEILSEGNSPAEMAEKRRDYFAAGTRLIWEIDLKSQTARVYDNPQSSDDCHLITADGGLLDGADVLPGFQVALAEVFLPLAGG